MTGGEGEIGAAALESSELSASQKLSLQLSSGKARSLEAAAWSLVPSVFQDLISSQRTMFLEICCSPDSILTETIQSLTGKPEAASRCSHWNCGDLSTGEGVKHILQRLEIERPVHVWLSPPCGPYSPLQNGNCRTPEQQQALEAKRAEAMRIYVGACIIFHECVQRGIHVSLELSERCQAWRLPLFYNLKQKYSLYDSVCKGCRVGLRDKQGCLLQKGWRVMTTHRKLAEALNLPCRCPRNQKHGRCEGSEASQSERYTKVFAKLVSQATLQELDYSGVLSEGQGSSQLASCFGEGSRCMCAEVSLPKRPRICGHCLLQTEGLILGSGKASTSSADSVQGSGHFDVDGKVSEGGSDEGEEGVEVEAELFCEEKIQELEILASRLLKHQDFQHSTCEQFLELIPFKVQKRHRKLLGPEPAIYVTLGAYSHGNHYGVTNRSKQLPNTTKYLLNYMYHWNGGSFTSTSLAINMARQCPIHRDIHNDPLYPNRLIGLGEYEDGGLWVETPGEIEEGGAWRKVSKDGRLVYGQVQATRHRLVTFPPKAWHGPEAWKGNRVTLTSFVSRGFKQLQESEVQELRAMGFRVPVCSNKPSQALVGTESKQDSSSSKHIEHIRKQLYRLHAATGHGSLRSLVEMLKRRHVQPKVLEVAKQFRCSICEERRGVQPRHLASLEVMPPKWSTVSADIGHWKHPNTGEQVQFMLVIDEGSRFRVARILSKGSKQQPRAAACLGYLREGWAQYFGMPKTLRLDPAGVFRGQEFVEFCDREGIFLDNAPADAHWQVGVCENAIQGTKTVLDKICSENPEVSPETALTMTVAVFNQREHIRGFSPIQHAFGRSPDSTGRLLEGSSSVPEEALHESASQEFEASARLREAAERAHSTWNASQRISRAKNSKARPNIPYEPGDLVYFWRSQVSGQSRTSPGSKRGRFLGPARILATESRKDADGTLRPGSAVWCIRGRQLIKCAPEQLRPASEREEMLDSLARQGGELSTPWTFTKLAEEIGGNQYEDATGDIPTDREWSRAQDPEEEEQPARFRITRKRAAEQPVHQIDELERTPSASSRGPRTTSMQNLAVEQPERWFDQVDEQAWTAQECGFWTDEQAAVEIAIDLPQNGHQWEKAAKDLTAYFVSAMRKQATEVSERKLSAADKEKFKAAKMVEVKNFLAARAFEALPPHLQPSRDQAIGMRWVLTWKTKDTGEIKAKARAVLLGYQDPCYEHRSTTSPVMTRQSRQFQLQLAANQKWSVFKGDVSGAFLQGRSYPSELHCVPCDEICAAMGVPAGSITRLRRACYGLVDAPLEWYRTVSEMLASLGLTRLWSDACAWVYRKHGRVCGMITGHVDDFLFSGNSLDADWARIIQEIKSRFQWGDWEQDNFVQCGVRVTKVI